MKAGVFWAVAGGIKALVRLLSAGKGASRHRKVLLTGGDAELLAAVMDPDVTVWPYMTLEGIRLSAEALP
jgi:pantothenate kinase type III